MDHKHQSEPEKKEQYIEPPDSSICCAFEHIEFAKEPPPPYSVSESSPPYSVSDPSKPHPSDLENQQKSIGPYPAQKIVTPVRTYPSRSLKLTCPLCSTDVETVVDTEPGLFSVFTFILCLPFCCLPCCFLPCCWKSCGVSYQRCPNCAGFIGYAR